MDYTTVANVKAALGATSTAGDVQLATLVTRASRAIDRQLYPRGPDNYLLLETVTEIGLGYVDGFNVLHYWPRKPRVTTITSLMVRETPRRTWEALSLDDIAVDGYHVQGYELSTTGKLWVSLAYTGGLASDVASLPADIVEVATVLAVRFYREAESGLTDAIGVAELGTLTYTKALPARVVEMLKPYVRRVP